MLLDAVGYKRPCRNCGKHVGYRVHNTRNGTLPDGSETQIRKRQCANCGHKFCTVEVVVQSQIKIDWQKEETK